MRRKVLIRCDAGPIPEIGTGHLRRCLLIAEQLAARGSEVVFLTASADEVVRTIPYPCRVIPPGDAAGPLSEALAAEKPEIVVWDRLDTGEDVCRAIKAAGAILVTLDDEGPGQRLADVTINAMVAGGDTIYKGPDYAVLPKESAQRPASAPRSARSVFVSFGGYDHGDMTARALEALRALGGGVQVRAAVGAATPLEPLRRFEGPTVRIFQSPPNFGELLREADVALVAGGLTLIEAMASGVPCLAWAQYDHQLRTIQRMEKQGAVVSLGGARAAEPDRLLEETRKLLDDEPRRRAMARKARRLVDGLGLVRVRELCTVVERLEWDSAFFGMGIAYLYPRRINEDLVRYAFRKCREDGVRCLYYLCDCHHPLSVRLAEKHGFHFVDIRLTFSRELDGPAPAAAAPAFAVRPAGEEDVPALAAIASKAYVHSRYYFDRHFPDDICEKFYSEWVAKSVRGYADRVFVAERDGKILGFISCKMAGAIGGAIPLVGVAEDAVGLGVGKTLVSRALAWFREQGVSSVEVVTQGRNYAAQRLYQSCGFRTKSTELWYHRWFEEEAP